MTPRGSVFGGIRAGRGKVVPLLGLISSLAIVHASKYEPKPADVTKGANKFSSAQSYCKLSLWLFLSPDIERHFCLTALSLTRTVRGPVGFINVPALVRLESALQT